MDTSRPIVLSLGLVSATLPFLVSLFVALRRSAQPKGIWDYFLYNRTLDSEGFLTTSVGYSLQVAAIVLFLFWTFEYGLTSLFVPIAWGLGYIVLYMVVKRGYLDDFIGADLEDTFTIHGYVGQKSQNVWGYRPTVVSLALTTVMGIGGTFIAEVDYATGLVLKILGLTEHVQVEVIHVLIILFTGSYVLWGGYRAVVKTDMIQVPLSVLGITAVILLLAWNGAFNNGYGYHSAIISASLVLLFLSAYVLREYKIFAHLSDAIKIRDRLIFIIIIVSSVSLFITSIYYSGASITGSFFTEDNTHFWGFGLYGVISLTVANGIWQFVDISSLQRLQSIDPSSHKSDKTDKILDGLICTSLESGIVWVMVILLAFSFKASGITSYYSSSFESGLLTLSGLEYIIIPVFIFSVVAFLISTSDGFISAISYVAYLDLVRIQSDKSILENDDNYTNILRWPRRTTFASLFIIYAIYLILKANLPESDIDAILYAVYAVQITIAPAVMSALFKPDLLSGPAVICSLIAGWAAALITALSDPWLGIPQQSWGVIPPLMALVSSLTVFIIVSTLHLKTGWSDE